jgi:DNA-binding SARP family transcriptional activator
VDAVAFEQGATAASLAAQREALELYQGDFLAQFAVREAGLYEEWTLFQRERLRGLALDALYRLAEASLTAADYDQAITDLRRPLALDPWREAAPTAP